MFADALVEREDEEVGVRGDLVDQRSADIDGRGDAERLRELDVALATRPRRRRW